ncbi:hypothetical protein H5410_047279 [Solanum commersonii]|uniref:Uncharacterized protein n=1 Tax=Solanum commersonii TaxID=4109 RepID=A0A9J5XGN0_SOLCO|nr:hypothetical protein H5410_047279 [Solanum commersonii]
MESESSHRRKKRRKHTNNALFSYNSSLIQDSNYRFIALRLELITKILLRLSVKPLLQFRKKLKLGLCHMQLHHQNICQKMKFIQYLDEHVEIFSTKPKFQICVELAFFNNEEKKGMSNQEM